MTYDMFTGLVEATGRLAVRESRGPGFRLVVESELADLVLGESISVSGACLTVTQHAPGRFSADVSTETVQKTTLGRLAVGSRVNLERALRVGDRMGGHVVTGHVDAVGRVRERSASGEAVNLTVAVPRALSCYVAPKGSIALDGVSLTVNVVDQEGFQVMLIPHTLRATTLSELSPGSSMNVEVDLMARYVARHLEVGGASTDQRLQELLATSPARAPR